MSARCSCARCETRASRSATALEERGIPYRLVGSAAFFERSEVRDLLSWLRLLADPGDGRAVVRALVRPPVELGPVDLARTTLIARRRKMDMVSALKIALESPEISPEARDRIELFLRLHRAAVSAFDEMRPDLFVHRLIERVGLRKQYLFSDRTESLERLVNIAKFADLAAAWVRREPGRGSRDFAQYIAAVAAAGLREEEATVRGRPNSVQVMTMHGAKGLEFDCVYVLGVQQSRMPGNRRGGETVPEQLLKEELPGEHARGAHRRDAAAAVRGDDAGAAAAGAVVARVHRIGHRRAVAAEALAVLRGGARGGRHAGGGAPRGAPGHPRGPLRHVPHDARRGARERGPGGRRDERAAPRRAPRGGQRDGPLHGAAEARDAGRAPADARRAAGRDRRDQPGAGPGSQPGAARALSRFEPGRAAAGRGARPAAARRPGRGTPPRRRSRPSCRSAARV